MKDVELLVGSLRRLCQAELVPVIGSNVTPNLDEPHPMTLTPTGVTMNDAADWIEQALEVLRAVEWTGNIDGWKTCPLCTADKRAHAPDCKLAALIGAKVALC